MKKLLSILLALALVCGLALPAMAAVEERSADARLTQVTAKVKRTLGIGDEYTDFYSDLWENELAPIWNLNWSRDGESLTVEATEEGKITGYYLYEDGAVSYESGFRPSFPATTREEAKASAAAFLSKVLAPMEKAVFNESGSSRLDASSHRFSGEITLNGLPSPLSFSVTVRASDGKVTRFHRDTLEGSVIGGVPSSRAATAQGTAGALLKDTLSLRLEYVLDGDGGTAVLRYLPNHGDEYYVDAQTGELVNLDELYEALSEEGFGAAGGGDASNMASTPSAAPAAESAEYDKGLSDVELAGISKLEGVLSKEALDKELRAIPELGLGKYTLASASYSLDKETGDVTAQVVYSRKDDTGVWRRTVTCDGKSGDLVSVSSSAPYDEGRRASVDESAARKAAEEFLAGLYGGEFDKCALYESAAWTEGSWGASHSFTYARKENGYFFPQSGLRVGIDVTDGSISTLRGFLQENVAFDSAEGLVSEADALTAWFSHYDVELAYRNIPVRLDPNSDEARPLLDMGYSYFYGLTLSYALERDRYASGVDAKTGKVIYNETAAGAALAYSDLEGHWVQSRAEALAMYGVGWVGEDFQPDKALTQLDLVALLASTQGYRHDPEGGDADSLYSYAYGVGILTQADREDGREVTRGEVVKLMLDAARYGEVARLQGIYACSFSDEGEIPADLYGYAALAQGMGIVKGDGAGAFAAGRTATRAEAAVMLYNFMSR